ncbi:MAG: N-acetylmuramoyl-L-alanine amidase family protein [Alphaproteobacteria bacterium]
MQTVEQTKVRLLRGAVRDNLDTVAGIKRQVRARTKAGWRLWLWLPPVLGGLVYVLPTIGISSGKVPAPSPAKSPAISATASNNNLVANDNNPMAQTGVALAAPEPLDRAVLPLSVKTIVIDPGHGGKQTGAISDSGMAEKEITLDVALRLRRLMEKTPFEVFMTRQTDQTLPLEKRVAFANSKNADLFVSIHVNWMEPRTIRALETYFVGPSDDPATLNLARMENRESNYSFADYRRILEKIYVDARRDESRRLAKSIQTELYRSLRQNNPEVEDRGVKMAPFVVLVGTQMPAILAEISCLSNEDEVKLLTDDDYKEKIALALFKGIQSYAKRLNSPDRKGN